jgi:hypothetical protein
VQGVIDLLKGQEFFRRLKYCTTNSVNFIYVHNFFLIIFNTLLFCWWHSVSAG